jgi:hypothetical protein
MQIAPGQSDICEFESYTQPRSQVSERDWGLRHDKLMGQVAKRVEDKRLLKLIRAFLNAGVMENGLVSPSVEGTPQGFPARI